MNKSILIGGAILGLLSACQPIIHSRGNVTVEDHLNQFVVGKTTKADVVRMCGTPSLQKDHLTWIYVGAKSEDVAFHSIVMREKCVVKMTFDTEGILRSMRRIPLSDDAELQTDEEITQLITEQQAEKQIQTALHKGN